MRRTLFIRFVILSLIFSLALPVPALALNPTERQEINQAAVEIASLMQNIMHNYKGDITVQELYEAALRGIADALDDHSRYVSLGDLAAFERNYLGSAMVFGISYFLNEDGRVEIESVIPRSPAADAGMESGDVILRIDNVDWDASNFSLIASRLTSPELLRAAFELESGRSIELAKAQIDLPTVQAMPASARIPGAPEHVGYILIERFSLVTPTEMSAAIADFAARNITHVILDLRYNPGGDRDAVTDISRMLVPEGIVYTTVDRSGRSQSVRSHLGSSPFVDMVVLTNSGTASASELLALALSESGAATLVGQQTFGKGSVQTIFPLQRGDYFVFTTMEYFGRLGTRINNIGVEPNISVDLPVYLGGEIELDADNSSHRMPDVRRLLSYIGHEVGQGGNYLDPQTRTSIELIQQFHGLEPDGVIDTDTAALLDSLLHRALRRDDDAILAAGFAALMGSYSQLPPKQ